MWNKLSMKEKAALIKVAVSNGLTDLDLIKNKYNEYANGSNINNAKNTIRQIEESFNNVEYLGKPSHNYNFTYSEEWANKHGYYPDSRGHRDDRVKLKAHPTHPSKGTWNGDIFDLSEEGIKDVNYIFKGMNDGNQDPQAILTYKGGVILPEITITPKGNYIQDNYDNLRYHLALGGPLLNQNNPIESFNGGRRLPVVRYDDGGYLSVL